MEDIQIYGQPARIHPITPYDMGRACTVQCDFGMCGTSI